MFSINENIFDWIIIKTIQAKPLTIITCTNEDLYLGALYVMLMIVSMCVNVQEIRKLMWFRNVYIISTIIVNVVFVVSNVSSVNIAYKVHVYTFTSFIVISKHLAHLSTCSRLILTEIFVSKIIQFDITESTIPSQFAFNIIIIHLLIYNTFKLTYSSKTQTNSVIHYHLFITLICLTFINVIQFINLFTSEHFYTFIYNTLSLRHLTLIIYWCITLTIFSFIYSNHITQSNTLLIIKRKYYHFLIFTLLFPAIYYSHIEILRTLTLIVLYFMIVIEVIRNDKRLKCYHLIQHITTFIKANIDDRDNGKIVLTHIFLLSGVCSSLYYDCNDNEKRSSWYIGCITLAIGDSLCSIVGALFGRVRIYGNKRTLEGTVAGLTGCLGVLWGVKWLYGENYRWLMDTVKFGVVLLYEGVTEEIDNLVLPIVANSLFC